MLILSKFRKLCSLFSFKLIVVLLVCIFIVNVYLFYNLKSISYLQNTVHVLQNKQALLEQEKTKVTDSIDAKKETSKRSCKVGNYSVFISDVILQLKEDLEEFYSNSPNVTSLAQRCNQFLQDSRFNVKHGFILTEDGIDFATRQLLIELKTATVLQVENAPKGSQLKLLAYLTKNVTAIIKPKWYSPFDIITGPVYAGKDRHYGEVIAFYLSILLGLPKVPPAVVRRFDLQKEIISVADSKLLSTFLVKGNKTCFYGVCHYCNPMDLLCMDSKTLEGSVIYYLSSTYKLKVLQHPWRRTYRCSSLARWEIDENYCTIIRNSRFYSSAQNKAVLLDHIDVAIFDFLIGNGDRHHFEFVKSFKKPRVLMVDNGKSFGNPYVDHIDILAPLYHCCTLRNSTWNNLLLLRGGELSKWLQYLLNTSDSDVVVNYMHFQALDRRLLLVFATLKYCFQKTGMQNVLVDE